MSHDDSIAAGIWHECPAGALRQLSRRLRVSKRNQAIRRVSTVLATIVVIFAGVWSMIPTSQYNSDHSQLSCAEAQTRIKPCIAGRLPQSTADEIAAHLHSCPACAAKLRQMRARAARDETMVFAPTHVVQHHGLESAQRGSTRVSTRNMLTSR